MRRIIILWCKLKAMLLVKFARTEVTVNYATVAQLMYEYDQLPDKESKDRMLEWAKDPKNPNPNALYFYQNVMRFG